MKTNYIILQFGASMTESLSASQLVILWGSIILFVALFIFFLIRTDKIISNKNHPSDHYSTKNNAGGRNVTDEEAAAIALAINMYKRDLHDMESFTITLKKVSRIYSPWSSKIYTLRQNPKF
jgi:hypothetical protein